MMCKTLASTGMYGFRVVCAVSRYYHRDDVLRKLSVGAWHSLSQQLPISRSLSRSKPRAIGYDS